VNQSIHKPFRIAGLLSVLALTSLMLSGCVTAPVSPPGAAEVRAKLDVLQADPNLRDQAPVEIREAESAVTVAEEPLLDDPALGEYRVFMADRKVEIAMAKASTRYAEGQRKELDRERAQARLDARTLEADRSHRRTEMARSDAESSRETAAAALAEASELQKQIDILQAEATDRGLVLTLGNVLFATGRSELEPGGTASLDKLVVFLNEYPNRNAEIEGHTDDVGSAELNQTLSLNRARSAMAYLTQHGIQPTRLTAAGMGETRPVADNDSAYGRQQNRRVEIIIENPPSELRSAAAL
jgi:outer membrane protein OmpA-like peptidoglycan-associated protein